MSKDMVNALKAQVRGLKYANLRGESITESMNSDGFTYLALHIEKDLIINGQKVPRDFINGLYSKHENLISRDENGKKNYRPFLREVFVEMFQYAKAKVPNDSILEELITYYNQFGYIAFLSDNGLALRPFSLDCTGGITKINIECHDPNYFKYTFSRENEGIRHFDGTKIYDLRSSVEFKLKFQDGNVTYEDGKVSLTIPKELKNYKVNGKNLFDIIVEYFQKFCEKLGFKFETKIEHDFGKPLTVTDKPDIFPTKDLKLKVNN